MVAKVRLLKLLLLSCFALYLVGCVTPPSGGTTSTPPVPTSGIPSPPTAGVPTPGSSGDSQDSQEQQEGEESGDSTAGESGGSGSPPPTGGGPQTPPGGNTAGTGEQGEEPSDSTAGEDGSGGESGSGESGEVASDIPVWETPETSGGGSEQNAGAGTIFSDADLEDLERTLDEALGTFDGDILREQENVRNKTGNVGSAGGQPQVDVFAGVGEFEDAQEALEEARAAGAGDENQEVFDDGPPPSPNDDVVARQIREAAERETDPEQRKILWEEYERYRDGG